MARLIASFTKFIYKINPIVTVETAENENTPTADIAPDTESTV